MGEKFLGKIDMKSVKGKGVKFYPGIMACAKFDADFQVVFD